MEHVVILIHGTWGSRSSWLEPGESPLRAEILRALGCGHCEDDDSDCCVRFEVFRWSGANRIGARLKASRQLRQRLRKVREKHPDAKVHAVAHSHGGNVAMYALRDGDDQLDSLTCLSTPFLHAAARTLGVATGRLLSSALSLMAVSLIAGVAAIVWWIRGAEILDWIHGAAFWPAAERFFATRQKTAVTLMAVVACVFLLVLDQIWRWIHNRSHRLAPRLKLPSTLGFPVLIIRGAGDEAHATLDAAQLSSTLITKCLKVALFLFGNRAGELRIASRGGLIVIVAGLVLAFIGGIMEDGWYIGAGFTLVLVVPLLMIGALVGVTAAVLGLAVLMLSFGGGMTVGVSLYISTESTPPGTWSVSQLTPLPYAPDTRLALRHYTHSDERALAVLREWLSEQFGKRDRPSAAASA